MLPVPKGFSFAAAACGFKQPDRLDLGIVLADEPAATAGVFTTNLFKAAPVVHCQERLAKGKTFRALVGNSGQANACTGEEGYVNCGLSLEIVAEALGLTADELLPTSTGVIGPQLKIDKWRAVMPALKDSLGTAGAMDFAKAIMTTDAFPKLAWGSVRLGGPAGKEARVLGIAKGAGMIAPNMATMLGYILTDAAVSAEVLQDILGRAVESSFNRITVDGDTSTNDTVLAMASGASGLDVSTLGQKALEDAITDVCQSLAYMIVQDAEGGTKVARIRVVGAEDEAQAELAARAVGTSPLVKTALFGQDPNWGRIVAAVGRSGAVFNPDRVAMAIGGVTIFEAGRPLAGDVDSLLAPVMRRNDVSIEVRLGDGPGEYVLLASDLGHGYVTINAEYTT
jgi:glutamate N-acetyltransferase/amino-acid N-acetyltransferase